MHWILLFVAPVAGDIFYVTVTTTLTQFIPWAANMSTESVGVFYPSHSLDPKVPSSTWTPHEGDTSTKEPDGLDGVETMWRPSARAAPSVISETFVTTDSGTNCGEAHGPLYPDNEASVTYVRTSGESKRVEIEVLDDAEEGIGDGQIKRVGKEISVGEVTEVGEVSGAHVIWSQITEISPIVIAGTGLEMATECVTSGSMNSCTDLSDATMTETADVTTSAALSVDYLLTTPTDRVDTKMEILKQLPSHLSAARYFSLEIVPPSYPFPYESTSLSSSSKGHQNQIHLTTTNSKPFFNSKHPRIPKISLASQIKPISHISSISRVSQASQVSFALYRLSQHAPRVTYTYKSHKSIHVRASAYIISHLNLPTTMNRSTFSFSSPESSISYSFPQSHFSRSPEPEATTAYKGQIEVGETSMAETTSLSAQSFNNASSPPTLALHLALLLSPLLVVFW